MPHFMVRKKRSSGCRHNTFQAVPQTGKRFFYHLSSTGRPINDNTVINYECTLYLSEKEFIDCIQKITGNRNPTVQTQEYGYHLDKKNNVIDINYCKNILGLPNNINGYNLATIGIAANYNNKSANGNILFIFSDINNQDNEACISIHIGYSVLNKNYLNTLKKNLAQAVSELDPQNNALWQLNPWDDFDAAGYTVTMGHQQEANYRIAYEREACENDIGSRIASFF